VSNLIISELLSQEAKDAAVEDAVEDAAVEDAVEEQVLDIWHIQ